MLSSREIRQGFIDYFVETCGHTFVPGSPVVPPPDETTLLFTNAGMNQFKDVFLGAGSRPYRRAANSQACIRASGKHNDLDDVGRSRRHQTLFEMLGNWSFGDYFKAEAIRWAWDLLTKHWGLPKDRLYATVYAGDDTMGVEPDHDARRLWQTETDIPHDHILWSTETFWAAGDVGPCGPCSEIHIDRTPDASGRDDVDKGNPLVMEIWNLVFMQYTRDSSGKLTLLPAQSVDTGMGLERIVAVLQGVYDNYSTDLFTPLVEHVQQMTGTVYRGAFADTQGTSQQQLDRDIAVRVIADHVRCLTFALSDGASVGNKGRDAVLRSILRRASRFAYQKLEQREPVLYKLVPTVVERFGHFFPQLTTKPRLVQDAIRDEEAQFLRTLDRGIALFEAAAQPSSSAQPRGASSSISAQTAFDLYTTFGFPFDLTRQMAEERGLAVDREGFARLMDEHAALSRGEGNTFAGSAALTLTPEIVDQLRRVAPDGTDDSLKYHNERPMRTGLRAIYVDGKLTNKIAAGQTGALVLEQTPFYVEMGGQVGDRGVITDADVDGKFEVERAEKMHGYVFHIGRATSGEIRLSEKVNVQLWNQRSRVRQHHTATHLLHWALYTTLGDHVQQRGSYVGPDRLRFDFDQPGAITPEQLEQIESMVNEHINNNEDVATFELDQLRARELFSGKLRAFFGDKYGDVVRVVVISVPGASQANLSNVRRNSDVTPELIERSYSVEFCGGTHTERTGEIGRVRIVSESAVSKGIRRVEAVAGPAAADAEQRARELAGRIDTLRTAAAESLASEVAQLIQEVDAAVLPLSDRRRLRDGVGELQELIRKAEKDRAKAATADLAGQIDELIAQATPAGGVHVVVGQIADAPAEAIRRQTDSLRKRLGETAVLLATVADGSVRLYATCTASAIDKGLKAGDWIREVAAKVGGKGGGKPDMAQGGGTDPAALPDALAHAKSWATNKLGKLG